MKRKSSDPPNPNGQEGRPLRIPLDFDEALRAALETPPPDQGWNGEPHKKLDRKRRKRYDRLKK